MSDLSFSWRNNFTQFTLNPTSQIMRKEQSHISKKPLSPNISVNCCAECWLNYSTMLNHGLWSLYNSAGKRNQTSSSCLRDWSRMCADSDMLTFNKFESVWPGLFCSMLNWMSEIFEHCFSYSVRIFQDCTGKSQCPGVNY